MHTYSSLNKSFLPHYKNALDKCDTSIVFVDPEAIRIKNLEPVSNNDIETAFGTPVTVVNSAEELASELLNINKENTNVLLMSSGNFGGLDFKPLFS